jgi:hypothetical protein
MSLFFIFLPIETMKHTHIEVDAGVGQLISFAL